MVVCMWILVATSVFVSYKLIWCRVPELQIDFTSGLSSELADTHTPKLNVTNWGEVKPSFSNKKKNFIYYF